MHNASFRYSVLDGPGRSPSPPSSSAIGQIISAARRYPSVEGQDSWHLGRRVTAYNGLRALPTAEFATIKTIEEGRKKYHPHYPDILRTAAHQ
jgi:hypothetical protein